MRCDWDLVCCGSLFIALTCQRFQVLTPDKLGDGMISAVR